MDWFIGVLLTALSVLDVDSSDPAIAAMKRAQLQAILCAMSECVCFALAYAIKPDESADPLVSAVQEPISLLFMGATLLSVIGICWNVWQWWRAYSKPELYFH